MGRAGFYQKNVSDYFPSWIETAVLAKEGGTVTHAVIDSAATLVYLANQGCITPHIWLSRSDAIDNPDLMVFDLDPTGDDFSLIRRGAQALHEWLEELSLPCYVQTSGSRGLHVFVPLDRSEAFDDVRGFARELAEVVVRQDPDSFTVEFRKEKRGDRIFIDTLRNAYAQTVVVPYAVRAKAGAPVATPLEWKEVGRRGLGPQDYTLHNVMRRLGQKGDSWSGADMWHEAPSLSRAREKLTSLTKAVR